LRIFSPRVWAFAKEVIIEEQTKIARTVLRDKFLKADIGVTGANFWWPIRARRGRGK